MEAPTGIQVLPEMTGVVTATYGRANILGDRMLVPVSAVSKDAGGTSIAWAIVLIKPWPAGRSSLAKFRVVRLRFWTGYGQAIELQ